MKRFRKNLRDARKKRIRVKGTKKIPRLSVFRSNKKVFVQLVDDENQNSIKGVLSAVSRKERGKIRTSFRAGEVIAKEAGRLKIRKAVFDRGGYKFHGRVKAVKEGAEKGGLIFKNNKS